MFYSALRSAARSSALGGTGVVHGLGFTILELMIVMTLLVAVTGLVMPSVLNRLGDSLAASTLSQIEATTTECRSQAQQEGRALRLIARERAAGTVGLYIERIGETDAISTGFAIESNDGTEMDPDAGLMDAWGGSVSSPVLVLPAGFSFSRTLPLPDEGGFNDPSLNERDSARDAVGGVEDDEMGGASFMGDLERMSMTLAVYLPDGTAIVERPLYLRADGQVYEIEINRWAGGVTTTRIRLDDEGAMDDGGFDERGFGRGESDRGERDGRGVQGGPDPRRGGGP
jgi:type II secretory pathway pseudopilin PulG